MTHIKMNKALIFAGKLLDKDKVLQVGKDIGKRFAEALVDGDHAEEHTPASASPEAPKTPANPASTPGAPGGPTGVGPKAPGGAGKPGEGDQGDHA